jgi:hypothetical protein
VGLAAGALLLLALVVAQPLLRSLLDRPLPARPPPERPPEVDLWVGDLAPGVKGVLSEVWNDPSQDAKNDAAWNDRLGLREADRLAYYQFVVFNPSAGPVKVSLLDGDLTLTPKGGDPLPMRSLARVLAAPSVPSPSVARTLAASGAGRDAIEVPAGKVAAPFVAFPRRVGLGEAVAVARADGTSFHRRRIPREGWDDRGAKPDAADLEDL